MSTSLASPPPLAIHLAVEDERWRALADIEDLARRAIEAAIVACGEEVADDAELSLVLCDDAFIAELNGRWRGIAKPTNVLSFPIDAAVPALGDVVIAFETVAREAAAEGRSLGDHLSHMIVHGFLHLLGFDHGDEGEAEVMEALEIQALAALGISSPYGDAAGSNRDAPLAAEGGRFRR